MPSLSCCGSTKNSVICAVASQVPGGISLEHNWERSHMLPRVDLLLRLYQVEPDFLLHLTLHRHSYWLTAERKRGWSSNPVGSKVSAASGVPYGFSGTSSLLLERIWGSSSEVNRLWREADRHLKLVPRPRMLTALRPHHWWVFMKQ
jgi:hypothetical protein